MEEEIEKEFELALQLKDDFGDKKGKNTDLVKEAEIIHEIALIYKKHSPDKLSLIKSVGLLNAAIIRNPSNTEINLELFEICRHILKQAKAENQNVNLVKKSEEVKLKINAWRKEVNVYFEISVPKISTNITRKEFQTLLANKIAKVKEINKTIADKYKQIMVDISQFCEDVMGKPPCEYAIVGMGSLAREEITPYSDFEHIILLCNETNYKPHLDYFKWYSVIFQVIILNLQETIVPSLNVSSLNDKNCKLGDWYYDVITPRGISFDGMMPHACKFPLGRLQQIEKKKFTTELIKPVKEMLEYLSSEADLKNGYHLADILTKTCFVFGKKDIFKQFVNGVQTYRDKQLQIDSTNDVKQQVKDDLNNFSTRFRLTNLKSQETINIKKLVYRSTTIFIAALARIYNLSANSSFDIIDEMIEKDYMTQITGQKLQCAIAIACEMRLRVYIEKKCQCDDAVDLKQDSIEKFLDIVGVASTVNYFQIAYCLQCEVAKQLQFTKLHFYSDPNLINIAIGLAFGMKRLPNVLFKPNKQFWNSSKFDFETCIEKLETQMDFKLYMSEGPAGFSGRMTTNEDEIKSIANYLRTAKIPDEALDFYKQLLDIYQRKSKDNNHGYDIAWINDQIGLCLNTLKQPANALEFLDQALKIKQNKTRNANEDRKIARTFHIIGDSNVNLHKYNDALNYLNQSVEIYQNTTFDAKQDRNIAATLHTLGYCHKQMGNYNEALKYLSQALEIRQNKTPNAEKDKSIATTLHEIGSCHINLHNHDKAKTILNQALRIEENATLNAENDRSIAVKLHSLALHCIDLHNFEDALTYLNKELKIRNNTTLNPDEDTRIAKIFHNIGVCHFNLHSLKKALEYLQQALQIRKNISTNAENDVDIATTLHYIGFCHYDMHNYDEALENLNHELEIRKNISAAPEEDSDIALSLSYIGYIQFDLHNYDEALFQFNRALEIMLNTKPDVNRDKSIAKLFYSIGSCHFNLQKFEEASKYLKRALKIYEDATSNAEKDKNVAKTLSEIGRCCVNLNNYDDALTYFDQALKIYKNTTLIAENDFHIAATLINIDRCHHHLHDYDKE